MPHSCKEALDALKSGNARCAENELLAHFESCPTCRNALELPSGISDEIANINLLPAPGQIYDNVMRKLCLGESAEDKTALGKWIKIGAVAAAYVVPALIIALIWNRINFDPHQILNNLISSLGIALSVVSSHVNIVSNIVNGISQSSLLITTMLMSATLAWAIALLKIRDFLRN
jgi:hypothetical protein